MSVKREWVSNENECQVRMGGSLLVVILVLAIVFATAGVYITHSVENECQARMSVNRE